MSTEDHEKKPEPAGESLEAETYSREEYATAEFWDNRYKENDKTYFDWYAEYPELK